MPGLPGQISLQPKVGICRGSLQAEASAILKGAVASELCSGSIMAATASGLLPSLSSW